MFNFSFKGYFYVKCLCIMIDFIGTQFLFVLNFVLYFMMNFVILMV